MRVLGTMTHRNGTKFPETKMRLKAANVCWYLMNVVLFVGVCDSYCCYAIVVNGALTGREGMTLTLPELEHISYFIVGKVRILMEGKAKTENNGKIRF